MSAVRFSVLGPVRVWRDDIEVDAGPKQQRSIMALMLVNADRTATLADLVDLLWEQAPPASAVNVLHKYIGGIRRLTETGVAGARDPGDGWFAPAAAIGSP